MKGLGGLCVKVIRKGYTGQGSDYTSEHALDDYVFNHTIMAPHGRLDLLCGRTVKMFDDLIKTHKD